MVSIPIPFALWAIPEFSFHRFTAIDGNDETKVQEGVFYSVNPQKSL